MSKNTPANDNDGPVVTLTRRQLEALVTKAVCEALDKGIGGPVLLDKQDLARVLHCSPTHIDQLRQKGMPWVPVGCRVRFEPAKVIDWLRAGGAVP